MKEYFAKYSPCEGVIPLNSLCFFKINGKWTEPSNFDDYLGEPIEDIKAAKLILYKKDNVNYHKEILTTSVKEGEEFTEEEKNLLILN